MPKLRLRHAFVAVMIMLAMLAQGTWALAGTTGGISGTLTDTSTGKPVASAKITAVSPSQTATTTTDAGGHFTFLSLAPDTYTVSADKDGYAPQSLAGVTVFADQSFTLSMTTHPELKTIAVAHSRAAGNLVKPGTTSDVYSVNAATQQVVSGSGGGFNLNSAYSGIYQQPGVTSYMGNAGWGQVFYIRGSSYSQIGYEFDGVPVNRAFDNYQSDSLSNLGQQELQVYTGGSPSGASSATLGGFINQVIKTGTYPGFGSLKGGIGAPGFYHALTAEAGGASPNRNFSYYVGLMGYNQTYPNLTWNDGSSLNANGLSSTGLQAQSEAATLYLSMFPAANFFCGTSSAAAYGCVGNIAPINGNAPDFNSTTCFNTGVSCGYALQWGNGPWPACQNNTTSPGNGGIAVGNTAANPGPFNGACLGYGPYGAGFLVQQQERDTVLNFHFGIPHKFDQGRDDLQLLYDNSMQYQTYGSSLNDNGGINWLSGYLTPFDTAGYSAGTPWAGTAGGGLCGYEAFWAFGCSSGSASPIPYADTYIFAPGTQFGQSLNTAKVAPYYFPNSPTNRSLNDPFVGGQQSSIDPTLRDGTWNDVGIVKAQYTKNIGSNAYAKLYGYTMYSDWLISSPSGVTDCYLGGYLQANLWGQCTGDYELTTHTRGAEFQFADQLNPQNLLRLTANYTTAGVTRFNNGSWLSGYFGSRKVVANLTNGDPNNPLCFSKTSGNQASCFSSSTAQNFGQINSGAYPQDPCATGALAPTTPACVAGATWKVTVPGGQGTYNTVKPIFTSVSLEDEFKPSDRWDLNLGVRFESYRYDLRSSDNPEFNFWFNEGAQVNCYDPGTGLPMTTPLAPGNPVPPNPVQTQPLKACGTAPSGQEGLHPVGNTALCNGVTTVDCGPLQYSAKSPSSFVHNEVSPRIGGTYTMDPDDVLRFSVGKYTQPTETAFEQYLDQSGKRAATFDFSQFWGLGFHTPGHDNPVQYSNNYDFSVEHHFKNTDITMKVSPFYRDTHNQLETVVLGPGFVGGVNAGHQHSYGVEVGIQKGDPSRDGFSGGISYTYTKALVQYQDLPNGKNAIDNLNDYIKAFNGLTQAGGGSPCYNFSAGEACPATLGPNDIVNPYYNMSQQPLLDRTGWYQTYPNESPNSPFDQGGASAIAPHTFAGWLQFKHDRLSIAPNFQLFSGTYYGSPVDTLGIDPRACGQNEGAATTPAGTPVLPAGSQYAGLCDFLTSTASPFVSTGQFAIPNPYTGKFDSVGQFQEPWQFNLGALIQYRISPKVSANLSLTNIVNTCFGGTSTPWQKAFKPGRWVCGYGANAGNFIGTQPGTGFFYGASGSDAANGGQPYATAFNYPFAPYSGALPFQAYLDVQIKL
ncbi:MAG TPA: TonB-dependent receptor [Candidatus Baltobacteraceae bacterium]|nr:TonB-dependent receptor [Candidatus Baltobacteraceae bacterium]